MKTQHVSLAFAQLPDAELGDFTQNVITRITGNPAFPTPPVTVLVLTTSNDTFTAALAAAAGGGVQATAAKNAARDALLVQLRQVANYVQGAANNDLPTLLSSGFEATNGNTSQSQLDKPVILRIENEISTQLLVRLTPITNARAYEMRTSVNGNGGWHPAGVFTQARRVPLTELTPGTTYNVSARAVGGSTGYSDWSDPVSHMAT